MWSIVNCGGAGGERVIFSWENQKGVGIERGQKDLKKTAPEGYSWSGLDLVFGVIEGIDLFLDPILVLSP